MRQSISFFVSFTDEKAIFEDFVRSPRLSLNLVSQIADSSGRVFGDLYGRKGDF
ncbi:MAG: hypothetical protein K5930_07010 [Treponemataceae bacterium]|nr:hypothetical protein [Treponemataceae bacterium]